MGEGGEEGEEVVCRGGAGQVDGTSEEQVHAILANGPLPELFIFDLDYTCWPCYVDALTGPPFTYDHARGIVLDRRKWEVELYKDVRAILLALEKLGCKVAVASRTEEPEWAKEVLKLIKIDERRNLEAFLHAKEIYPGSKENHFRKLQETTGVALADMLFYDDEHRNILEVSRMGVVCYHCEDGLSLSSFTDGLTAYRRRRRNNTDKQRPADKHRADPAKMTGGEPGSTAASAL